jgi:hypothetical protein
VLGILHAHELCERMDRVQPSVKLVDAVYITVLVCDALQRFPLVQYANILIVLCGLRRILCRLKVTKKGVK